MNSSEQMESMLDNPDFRFSDIKLQQFNRLMENELQRIYAIEKLQMTFLGKIIPLAIAGGLIDILEQHAYGIQDHRSRLEKIFLILGLKPLSNTAKTAGDIMELMFKEAISNIKGLQRSPAFSDRVIIMETQKMAHYRIALYMTLSGWAKSLRLFGVGELLEDCLDEIINTDLTLSELAESTITDQV